MNLVLDSSALITLARIGRLELLRQAAGVVHIPEAVYEEVVQAGQGRHGSVEIAQAQWISRHQVQDQGAVVRLRARLGKGEAEAIVLARELQANVLLLDDATASSVAGAEGQTVVALVGLWSLVRIARYIVAPTHGDLTVVQPMRAVRPVHWTQWG